MLDRAKALGPLFMQDRILADASHHVGKVTLTVHDLDRVARFYQDVIGLTLLGQVGDTATLGTVDVQLLDLNCDPTARRASRYEAGLFHTAFLLPIRADLGAWLRHMADRPFIISGAQDHIVSESIYLADPEGNGIEVYADRPSSSWTRTPEGFVTGNELLDLDAVLGSAASPWSGMPEGGCIGHAHLQVGDLPRAEAFYAGLLGFDVMAQYPGGLFYGSGGYHHQLATNVWNSLGAPTKTDRTTGLAEVELLMRQADALRSTCTRFENAEYPFIVDKSDVLVRDPWGTLFRLVVEA